MPLASRKTPRKLAGHRLAAEKPLIGRRRCKTEGQELNLLHVDQVRACARRHRIAVTGVAAHGVGLGEVERREPSCRNHDRRRADRDQQTARGVVDQAADNTFAGVAVIAGCEIEKPSVFQIVDLAGLKHRVPVGVTERNTGVGVADRATLVVAAEWQGQRLRRIAPGVDRRAQAVDAVTVIGRFRVLRKGVGDRLDGKVAAGNPEVLGEHGLRIVIRAGRAHGRNAFGNLGVGTADRVLGNDENASAVLRRRIGRMAAGPAGAHDDHVIVAPFGIDRHCVKPSPAVRAIAALSPAP